MHTKRASSLFRPDRFPGSIVFGSAAVFLAACSAAPSQETVGAVIRTYFENRGYRVLELQISAISPVPLSQKTYMGTQGHVVEISKISLEVLADSREFHKGEKLTFSPAEIRIRQTIDNKDEWIIANISGIGVP